MTTAFQPNAFQNNTFQITSGSTVVGPVSAGLDTVLTNRSGKHFTKQQKAAFIDRIYQDGLLAKEALARLDNSELAIAERNLAKADKAYQAAFENRILTGFGAILSEDVNRAYSELQQANDRVDALRKEAAKKKALNDAKERIRQQVKDALRTMTKWH